MLSKITYIRVCLILCLGISILEAQVTGVVTDQNNVALSYVNVYLKNTSIGTTTNYDGNYSLKLSPGEYELVFQYIGYKTLSKKIILQEEELKFSVSLETENYTLGEVVINAAAEDPAYKIIRAAQAQRNYNKDQLSNYEVDAYVKGFNKVSNVPKKIFGMELDELDDVVDSTGSGVVYLSESVSKLYYKDGQQKEVMVSSKVSGNDGGYSFNSAKEMGFNFYDNSINLNKEIVTPIAKNAMAHYRYELTGTQYEDNGQLVNKIKVIPKNEFGNAFFGYIYINEDLWNIHSIDLNVTKHSTGLAFIDTLNFNQVYAPISDSQKWAPLSNVIKFSMNFFGVGINGNFACVYSNYELGHLTDKTFNKEIFKVLEEANEHSDSYWDTLRPLPLTIEEKEDYTIKDSIRLVRESPEYLDSIDRISNKFKLTDILFGYSHRNSIKRSNFSYSSPISQINVNTIQGWNSTFGLKYNKTYNKNNTKRLLAELTSSYGLSEKTFRPELNFAYLSNRVNNAYYTFKIGQRLEQYSRQNPITNTMNSITTLFFRENFLKAYDKKFIHAGLRRDLVPGLTGSISIDYEKRNAVVNNYNGGLKQDSKDYTSNNPTEPLDFNPAFEDHNAFIFRAHLIINIGQKIWSYPDRVFKENSSWPTIGVYYKAGLNILDSDTEYNLIYTSLYKDLNLSIYGKTSIYALGGTFVGQQPQYFIDNLHFLGNQTHIGYPPEYSVRFLNMPYYANSTNDDFFQLHLQHHFTGYIFSKLPLLKHTGFQLVAGYKLLERRNSESYDELSFGIDNIGFKVLRLFRLDFVWSKKSSIEKGRNFGVVLGINTKI